MANAYHERGAPGPPFLHGQLDFAAVISNSAAFYLHGACQVQLQWYSMYRLIIGSCVRTSSHSSEPESYVAWAILGAMLGIVAATVKATVPDVVISLTNTAAW